MTYGLTPQGFIIKRLPEIKAELEASYRAAFGNIDVSPASVFGQLIGIAADREYSIWELMELVYLSRNPNSAEGVALDDAAALTNIRRLSATKSQVLVVMYTESTSALPVPVPAGTQVAVAGVGTVYELDEDTDIDAVAAVDVTARVLTAVDGGLYRVLIRGNAHEYTAGPADTTTSIATALAVSINTTFPDDEVSAIDNSDGTFRILSDLSGSIRRSFGVELVTGSGATPADFFLTEVGSQGHFSALAAGITAGPAGTITDIVTPVTDLDRVENLSAATQGSEIETDTEFRVRRRESLQIAGAATVNAIQARILNDIEDVEACSVFENDTMVDNTPTGGLPPKSFVAVVTGGDEQEIAELIWRVKPAGIATWGDITRQVIDSSGNIQNVRFSRPVQLYAHVDVVFEPYNEEQYPGEAVAVAGISDSILRYGRTFRIGQDMIRDRFFAPIFTAGVEGIGSIVTLRIALTVNPGDSPVWGTADIPLAPDEIAIFADSRIHVAEAP